MSPLLATACLLVLPISSDTLQVRRGFFVGFDLGPALLNYECRGCPEAGAAYATHGRLGFGTAVSSRVTVGLEFLLWRRQSNSDGAINTMASLAFYPRAAGGAFLAVGAGLASFQGVELGDGPRERGSGPAVSLGVGYDARFSKQLSLTPRLSVLYSSIGTTHLAFLPARRDTSSWVISLGLGLTWH